jgi:hypothetical protein
LSGVKPKRRLPVLQAPADGDPAEPARPPWQWVVFGALGIFVVWLPLQALAAALAGRSASGAALAASSLTGGFVVGRWGAERVGVREATLAGLAATLVAIALSWMSSPITPAPLLLTAVTVTAIAVPMAALGGKLGLYRRLRGHAN